MSKDILMVATQKAVIVLHESAPPAVLIKAIEAAGSEVPRRRFELAVEA
jgi:hypothetical protein